MNDFDLDFDSVPEPQPEPMLFDQLKPGLQPDGISVLADLGSAAEDMGIEYIVGVAGFDSEQQTENRARNLCFVCRSGIIRTPQTKNYP